MLGRRNGLELYAYMKKSLKSCKEVNTVLHSYIKEVQLKEGWDSVSIRRDSSAAECTLPCPSPAETEAVQVWAVGWVMGMGKQREKSRAYQRTVFEARANPFIVQQAKALHDHKPSLCHFTVDCLQQGVVVGAIGLLLALTCAATQRRMGGHSSGHKQASDFARVWDARCFVWCVLS